MADNASNVEAVPERTQEVEAFWNVAREHARVHLVPGSLVPSVLGPVPPPTWSFGDGPDADASLASVLSGELTELASPRADYATADAAAADVPAADVPEAGGLSILVDGEGMPRALLATTEVEERGEDVVERFVVIHSV